MGVLTRDAVQPPLELATEVVTVKELGGDVIVAELALDGRLTFEDALQASKGLSGRAAVNAMVPQLLAVAVQLEDGAPLYTVQQWRSFGARNRDAAITLFNTAMRLNGFGGAGEPEKN
jgi:hypothetical protein